MIARVRAEMLAVLPSGVTSAGSFARGVTATFATRIAGIAIGIFTLTATARLLGPDGRGQFAVTMAALALVLQFANAGLHSSATYWLAKHPERKQSIVGMLVWFSAVPVAVLCAVVFLAAWYYPALLPHVPARHIALALLSGPPAMFLLLAGNAFLGLGRPAAFNLLDLAGKMAGAGAVAALFWWHLGMLFAIYAVLQYAIALIAYLALAGARTPTIPTSDVIRPILAYGSRVFLVSFFTFLILRADLLLLNAFTTTAEAGKYSVAVQVGDVMTLGAASIAAMLFPRLTAMDAERRWQSSVRVMRVAGTLLAAGAALLGLIARPVFLGWLGVEFVPAVTALWLLLPGLWCLGMNTLLHQHLAASGMPWFLVVSTGVGAVLNIALNVMLIPTYGIVGAAVVSSITYALLLGASVLFLATPAGSAYRV